MRWPPVNIHRPFPSAAQWVEIPTNHTYAEYDASMPDISVIFTVCWPQGRFRPCQPSPSRQTRASSSSQCHKNSSTKSTTTDGPTVSHPAPKQSASSSKKAWKPKNLSRLGARLLLSPPPIPSRPAYPCLNPRLTLNHLGTPHNLTLRAISPNRMRRFVVEPALPPAVNQTPNLLPPIILMTQIPPLIRGIDPVRPCPRMLKIPPNHPHPVCPQPNLRVLNHQSHHSLRVSSHQSHNPLVSHSSLTV
jgi:hypothetical protein